ncbi:protein ADM2 [Trichechus inunguis]|uniref:Protein ADM2 n=1 Tax=Trichechus manatus latirostris TaxID=127582 RepID=A0A2Y9DS77_TRIMA|nr:protein ADM2 [Trichechus manatus latirostris]
MARLLAVTLGCISLLYLQLPGALSLGLGGRPRPSRFREPLARTSSRSLRPRHPAPQPVVWKLHQAPQPQKSTSLAAALSQPPQDHGRRHSGSWHSGPRRPRAQLLRVGCALGTCQVQNLSHRLWQLVGQASQQDLAPVDPSSPHSYG